jgi:hypothetical protein
MFLGGAPTQTWQLELAAGWRELPCQLGVFVPRDLGIFARRYPPGLVAIGEIIRMA